MQIWAMTEEALLWGASPPLYYATVTEVWDRILARHGPAPEDDTEAKLVGCLLNSRFGLGIGWIQVLS